ncbi:ABC transporter permease [Mycolicibacterium sp. YH-1]|uniref:ABC transporter permease n=1 Tax=Mycolicibacterium sp. YH-1 TaxID=2908837 RepID=UPI001F4BFF2D|nr:ABC transporter permease [Mycolicibacterium sp. YH-1]UNB52066.1 ABC transporter permease [Mycolicibacterium sp. YH-1]
MTIDSKSDAPPNGHSAEAAPASARGWLRAVTGANTFWILTALLLIIVAFSIVRPYGFATPDNARNITLDAASLLILACGQTYVMITGGIDLSVGSVLIFSSVVSSQVMLAMGGAEAGFTAILVGFVVALLGGLVWGLLNGVMIAYGNIPPLIATLGTLGMALGAAQLLTNGVDVREVPTLLNDTIGNATLFGIPWIVLIAAVVVIIAGLILRFTRMGRYTYAIGSNEEGARRAGISVGGHLLKVYGGAGLLAGLAGFINVARFATTTIAGHTTDNLNAIAATVIGGTSPFGGVGSILGTVIGVFIPAVLQNGFVIAGVQPFWQTVAVGAVLVIAVYFDLRRRAKNSR